MPLHRSEKRSILDNGLLPTKLPPEIQQVIQIAASSQPQALRNLTPAVIFISACKLAAKVTFGPDLKLALQPLRASPSVGARLCPAQRDQSQHPPNEWRVGINPKRLGTWTRCGWSPTQPRSKAEAPKSSNKLRCSAQPLAHRSSVAYFRQTF
jgi:hypothetical protein